MENKNLAIIITAFVTLLVGVILVSVIAGETNTVVAGTVVSDESLSIASARLASNNVNESYTFTLTNAGVGCSDGWVADSVSITNATGTSLAGNYTVSYTADTITFANNTYMVAGGGGINNATLVDYSYYPSDYLCESWNRTVINLLPGFFAIGVLLFGVVVAMKLMKNAQEK